MILIKSMLVQVQQKGGHAGQFTPEETRSRDRVDQRRRAGNSERSWPRAGGHSDRGWRDQQWADAEAVFVAKCAMCHINAQAGNLSLKTYTDTLKGGKQRPGHRAGRSGQERAGDVPAGHGASRLGMLTPEELAPFIAWIEQGAPEIASEEPPASEATPTARHQRRAAQLHRAVVMPGPAASIN